MKKSVLMFSLLSGTALMFPKLTIASGLPALTHTYTPEPKPAFQFEQTDKAYKTAAICFLGADNCGDAGFGSMGGDDGYKVDTVQQCKNEGFVSFCSTGYCMDKSCPYNPNYGNCLKENCPGNSSTICTGAIAGQNACGENCKKCCDDSCPVGSKNYTGSFASKTECGNNCYNCNTACPSGSLAYSGDIVSYNECGQACRSCNTSCPSGTSTSNPGGCGGSTSDECNTKTCYYPFQACCDNSCEGDKSGQCPSGYSEWTSTDGCGNTCYNCSCDLSYCVSDCEEDSRGATLRLKYKTCTMSNWEATSTTHYIFRSMGGYCVNVTGGRCMYDGSYWCSC